MISVNNLNGYKLDGIAAVVGDSVIAWIELLEKTLID